VPSERITSSTLAAAYPLASCALRCAWRYSTHNYPTHNYHVQQLGVDVGGTLRLDADDDWTCGDVLFGEPTDPYAEADAHLSPFCAAPAQFTSGFPSAAAPWFAGWSCTPA